MIWPRVVLIVGLSMIFAPINVAAFKYIPPHLRGAAVGLFALLRNEGGSVGTSMAQTIQERREHFHTVRVGEFLDPLNPMVNSFLEQAQAFFFQQTGDPAASQQMTMQVLANLRQQQAVFAGLLRRLLALRRPGAVPLVPLVLLMKRSVAEKGDAHRSGVDPIASVGELDVLDTQRRRGRREESSSVVRAGPADTFPPLSPIVLDLPRAIVLVQDAPSNSDTTLTDMTDDSESAFRISLVDKVTARLREISRSCCTAARCALALPVGRGLAQ